MWSLSLVLLLFFLLSRWLEGEVYIYSFLLIRCRIDFYTLSFFKTISIVTVSVGIWSFYYMDDEGSYKRFFSLLSAFVMRILFLLFVSNIPLALIGWDGLGLTSFLLVIYYKNRKRIGSGMLTALSNRLGDALFLLLIGLLYTERRTWTLLLMIGLRITKRAQFPMSAWLPAAMAAPTPVRALVHSSTLVTAGIYMLIRYRNHDIGPLLFVGSCTLLVAGWCACTERDLKKVVALRTLSQLGVICVALGAMEKSYCFFHLLSHAGFKALLFLCVGVCIHTLYGNQEFRRFMRVSPICYVSLGFCVANLSLIGFVFTSGYYSKDLILESIYCDKVPSWTSAIFLLGIGLTCFYSLKIISSAQWWSYSCSVSLSMGSYDWTVKTPILILSATRVLFGAGVDDFCGALSVYLCRERVFNMNADLILPLILLFSGMFVGDWLSRLHTPYLHNLFTLTPLVQRLANIPLAIENPQKTIDKGWIEAGSLTLSPLSTRIITHYSSAIGIGLLVVFLSFLFYA